MTIIKDNCILVELEDSYINKNQINIELKKTLYKKLENQDIREEEKYFILGYLTLTEKKDLDLSKKYFYNTLENISTDTCSFIKVYVYKFLSDIMIEENNVKKAVEYSEKAFLNINPKEYNEKYTLIADIFKPLISYKEGRDISIDCLNKALGHKNLNTQTKIYLNKILSVIYIVNYDYSEAIASNLKVIKLSEKIENSYYINKSIVDISAIARDFGAYEAAIEILNDVNSKDIHDEVLKADLEIYKYINLAQIERVIGDYEKALEYANQITKYEKYIPTEKRESIICMKNIIMADIYSKEEKINESKRYLDMSKDSIKDAKHVYADIEIYYNIVNSEINKIGGNYDESIKEINIALELLQEKPNTEYYRRCIISLIDIYKNMGYEDNVLKYTNILIDLQTNENDSVFKKYYSYIIYKENYRELEIKQENKKGIILILTVIVAILIIALSRLAIIPNLVNYKTRKNIKSYIKNNNYILNYQPIVNPKTNNIVGFEALLRLRIDDEIIMPNIIINEIEKSNMMNEVSLWILKKLINDYYKISCIGNLENKFYLSMNISLREIEDRDICNQLSYILKESNIEKNSICLEITESVPGENYDEINKNIKQLRNNGFIIAIDDFGVDYSNLSFLEKFEFDIIKLDKYFIDNLEKSIVVQSLVDAINYISIKKDITVVMEGVEVGKQKDAIIEIDSNKFYIQGYYYSRPVEIDKIKDITI